MPPVRRAKPRTALAVGEKNPRPRHPPDRYLELVLKPEKMSSLDDEEIFRMQLKDRNGKFTGQPPKNIPRELAVLFRDEQVRRFGQKIAHLLSLAFEALEEVLKKKHPQPGDGAKVTAALKVIERYAGKVPDQVLMQAEVRHEWKEKANERITVLDVDWEDV